MKYLALLCFVAFPWYAGAGAPKDAKKELDKIQGTWTMAEMKYNGKDLTNDNKSKFKLIFKGDTATVEGTDELKKEYAKVRFTLDPAANPRLVDMKIISGNQKDAVIEGIYELKGNEFRICANVFGNQRPAEFAAPEGSSSVVIVLKKES